MRQFALTFYLTIAFPLWCWSALATCQDGTLTLPAKFSLDPAKWLKSLHFLGLTVARKALKSLTKWGSAPGANEKSCKNRGLAECPRLTP